MAAALPNPPMDILDHNATFIQILTVSGFGARACTHLTIDERDWTPSV